MRLCAVILIVGAGLALAGNDAALSGPVVKWDKFYDRAGNVIPPPPGETDGVSMDSLYWRRYSENYLRYSAKVQSPTTATRTAMAFQYGQSVPCMTPDGEYVYEAYNTNLRRFSTADGSYVDFALGYTGGQGCATDGQYIYRPNGTTMYKYTMNGTYVNATVTNYSCDAFSISCVRDTVWFTNDRYTGVNYYGYACAGFAGGSISNGATWNVGTGTNGVGNIAWDGAYYYIAWIGTSPITFKRFNPDRTLYSTGTVDIDPRSVMCRVPPPAAPRVLVAGCYSSPGAVKRLADTLAMYASSYFAAYDTIDARVSAAPAAAALWAAGYRAILTYADAPYSDSTAWGNTLADFVELGGGVVVTCFGDYAGSGYHPAGAWNPRYTLWNLNNNGFTSATLGTVHQPAHPIMAGVTTVGCSDFRTAATTPMSSAYLTRIADWASGNPECVAYDSSDRRVVYLGFYAAAPFIAAPAPNSGDWIRQVNNALLWSATGRVGPGALIAGCYNDPTVIKRLADTLAMYGGYFSTYDTVNAYTSPPPSAAALWAAGYRAILTYSDFPYSDSLAWGDMLADFVELGGGVVVACFADHAGSGYHPAGAWNPRYTLWDLNSNGFTGATLGTVHQPAHPIMAGVSSVGCGNWRTAATTPKASAYVIRIADWASGNLECVAYDSSDRRVVYVGFYPGADFLASPVPNTGDWIRQLNNALRWSAEGGVAAVQSPPSAVAGFRVWPNPVRGILNLSLGSAPGNALVRLHDVTGRCVLSRTFSARERAAGVRLDLGDLAAGVYLMKLSAGGVSTAQKLVIQH